MSEMDLIIRGGRIVDEAGVYEASIAVKDGRIAAIGDVDDLPGATRTIDVQGQHVFPGIIDPHIHLQTFANPFDINIKTETKTAAVGGVTTIVPTLLNRENPKRDFFEYVPWCREAVDRYASIDVGFSAVIGSDEHIAYLPRMARELGISSWKFYMAYTQDEASVFGIQAMTDKQVLEGLRVIKGIGYPAMMMVHAENMSIIHDLKQKYIAEGRNDLKAWTDARPDIAEEEATRRAIWYAKETGSRLYIVHMTIGRGVEWVREAQAQGVDVIAETCPHYLVLTKFDHEKVGSLGKVNPPLRDEWNQERLWEGLRNGSISCLGSDHSTILEKEKKLGTSIWDAIPGYPGVGMLLPLMLSEGYHKGRLSLEQISGILATKNARVWGLFPRKGHIAVGADADFAIVDLEQTRTVTPEYMQSFADWGLYDGWELKGWPTRTIVRGTVVMEDGTLTGEEGYGEYISRPPLPARPDWAIPSI
jgi:dihydropyrimidinase